MSPSNNVTNNLTNIHIRLTVLILELPFESAFQVLKNTGLVTLQALLVSNCKCYYHFITNSLDSKCLPAAPQNQIYSQLMKIYHLGGHAKECTFKAILERKKRKRGEERGGESRKAGRGQRQKTTDLEKGQP